MTAPATLTENAMPLDAPVTSPAPSQQINFVVLWFSSLAFLFQPWAIGRQWLRASLSQAIRVALLNTFFALIWFVLVNAAFEYCVAAKAVVNVPGPANTTHRVYGHVTFGFQFAASKQALVDDWKSFYPTQKFSVIAGGLLLWAGSALLPFFVLLPFGARPGSNGATVRHVSRTVLLGSGSVHLWGAAYLLLYLLFAKYGPHTSFMAIAPEDTVSSTLALFALLGFWSLAAGLVAVRREFRRPSQYPQPHDPYCDQYGYILIAADAAGRCPECGRLVSDSLGPQVRLPTAWERHPSFLNFPVIAAQIKSLIFRPRELFFSMPTLTGQNAAQRWLLGSMVIVALLAALIVPWIKWVLTLEWNAAFISGSLAMALVWAVMAMMMVGIETAGVAAFSRMRGHGVPLATAAKVTAYSACLMWPWVILGGIQLLWAIHWLMLSPLKGTAMEQVILAGTIAAAHIGGLFHFELTVYRGIRAVQFANR